MSNENILARQIVKQIFHNASDFDLKVLQRVRYWIEKNTTRQILKQNFHNASDFHLNVLQRVIYWIGKKHNALDFELINLRRVRL